MTYTKEQVMKIIGPDLRHITDSKDIENVINENGGNVTWDEVANETQKEIDIQNKLKAEQRKRLENMKPKKTREVIKYC